MPSGKTHAVFTCLAAAGLYYALPAAGFTGADLAAPVAGCLAGILITPDLDVDNPTRSHYLVERQWGPLAYAVWRVVWLPYGWAIGHRSWVSHAPIISTLIRVLYMALIVWGVLALVGVPQPWQAWPDLRRLAIPAIAGLAISDVLHWAADIVSTSIKRRLRQKGYRYERTG